MLGPGRYLVGVAEIGALAAAAWLGATALRRRLAADLEGAEAALAVVVLAFALLLLVAELLGSFGLFAPVPYLCAVGFSGLLLWAFLRRVAEDRRGRGHPRPQRPPDPLTGPAGRNGVAGAAAPSSRIATLVALTIAALALLHFAVGVHQRLGTGMTGFDSTWYHGPFAAGFFQTGSTWDLHQIAPQFLAWFYPANAEVAHAVGMLAFGRDILSPLLNLGWLAACLLAAWCIGRPFGVAPWSLALAAVVLSVPALADQAGEARNDLAGTFFLLAGVALALATLPSRPRAPRPASGPREAPSGPAFGEGAPIGALATCGLCAGLAAGTKVGFLLPAAVLVVGLPLVLPPTARLRSWGAALGAALLGGGYWYLRNLAHTGNPLPWFDSLGPLSLPAPEQALGGREQHSVASYLTDGSVWSEWFLPGLLHGLSALGPLLLLAAAAGLALCLVPLLRPTPARVRVSSRYAEQNRNSAGVLGVCALAGLAAALAWLVAPTSASGPEGAPHGFESGLRYLAPALVLGVALLPCAPLLRRRLGRRAAPLPSPLSLPGRRLAPAVVALAFIAAAAVGYPVQRAYLRDRYAHPTFTTPGLDAAFAWARDVSGARIATTATRQYPLFGTDLSNRVQFVGEERAHGGFVAPSGCRAWRRLLDAGGYDYVVATRDRLERGVPPYPPEARWTEGPQAEVILKRPPTVVFRLVGHLDPAACPQAGDSTPAGE